MIRPDPTSSLYPHLSLPEQILGKICREAGSFPADATERSSRGSLVDKGKILRAEALAENLTGSVTIQV